jgi:hypothetical protein
LLSEASNIFVLADEAHRTQYGGLAANLRKALPNACFLGFTGTPIDKKDRSTLQTFGGYIDTYIIEQAVEVPPRAVRALDEGCRGARGGTFGGPVRSHLAHAQ